MDRYFTSGQQKTTTELPLRLCLVGRSGIGKTWEAMRLLGPKHVELTPEILKSKNETLEFLDKIQSTETPVLLDAYETIQDLVGLRELREPPTLGSFVVTSQMAPKFDFEIEVRDLPPKTFEQIKTLCPDATDEVIRQSKGDLRRVFGSLECKSDLMDDFTSPKEIVTSFVSTKSNANPVSFIGWAVSEPGNCSSILNANYVDGPRRLDIADIADDFSRADVIEDKVFAGNWDLLPYFNLFGIISPAVKIGHSLKEPLKPGSTWTKYQNMCMRAKKIQNASRRVPNKTLDVPSLLLLRDMAEKGEYEILSEYGIEPQDVDLMNHLSPFRKLKPKAMSDIKKWLNAPASPTLPKSL